MKRRGFRVEKDYLGKVKVPKESYYGAQTQRAINNFPISGLRLQKKLILAHTMIKKSAAISNMKLNKLDKRIGKYIVKACGDVLKGKLNREFKVDVYQAGAGTSQNMNLNEVIANRALQLMGKKKGNYSVINPNDHVNMSQSTNDTFHSAIHIAAFMDINEELIPSLKKLENELRKKGDEFKKIVKTGRTHLRDAVPITLGQEFLAYAEIIKKSREYIEEDSNSLRELNIGGTAIGTGLNASKEYINLVLKEINKNTKLKFKSARNLIEATQSLDSIAKTSSSLKNLAINLIKIANDLRLLSSGPVSGINEVILPDAQPGSSAMPGKINPVVAEMLDMVAFQVIGNDTTITLGSQAGQLELNVMTPLVAYNLLNSIEILSHSVVVFTDKCVKGIKANEKRCREYLERNPIAVTALTPYIGYGKAAAIAKKAYKEDRSVKEIILEKKVLPKSLVGKIFNFRNMTRIKR